MAVILKHLHPIKRSLSSLSSSNPSISHLKQSVYGKVHTFEHPNCWRGSVFQRNVNMQRKYMQKINTSGNKVNRGSVLGMSVLFGSMGTSPFIAWARDGHHALVGDPCEDLLEPSEMEKQPHYLWIYAGKILLPVFLFLTVWRSMDDPITLIFTKVTIILLSRKPGPLSVYVFVDQLCRQFMHDEPYLYTIKPLYPSKVEVQDYKLFCLANIVVKDQGFSLIGVLGDWWTLPFLPSMETFSSLKKRFVNLFKKTTKQDPSSMPPSPSSSLPETTESSAPIEETDEMPPHEELVMFRGLIKVSPQRAAVLEEACTKYPHLWEWHRNYRTRTCEWGYECLSGLLLFLKTHAPKDLNEESLEKFEWLCKEVEMFQFDSSWISSVRQRVIESVVNEETVRKQEKLEAKEAALLKELEDLRAELNIVKERLSSYDVPLDI